MEYGCIGRSLRHSFSPAIHALIGRYDYELREIEPWELADFMAKRDFRGINVTIPYKQAVIPYLDRLSEGARHIGAVNTIVNRDGMLYGDNTDRGGLCALLARLELEVKGKKALILGSGGTSRTAHAVLEQLGAGEIYRVSRSGRDGAIDYDQARREQGDAELIINATPCGMFPDIDEQPLDLADFSRLAGLADAIYNPLRSRLVLQARSCGARAEGGLYMLVAQAVLAAELFTGLPLPQEDTERIYSQLLAQSENLVLIGMPGSGKTSVGRLLGQELGREFVDVDELIVRQAGCSISQIFADRGEAGFRRLEAEAVAELAKGSGMVIATGGGAVLQGENRRRLRQNGRLILLDRPLAQLLPTADRPLANDTDKMVKLYRERLPLYNSAADLTVKVEGPPQSVARSIIRSLL